MLEMMKLWVRKLRQFILHRSPGQRPCLLSVARTLQPFLSNDCPPDIPAENQVSVLNIGKLDMFITALICKESNVNVFNTFTVYYWV